MADSQNTRPPESRTPADEAAMSVYRARQSGGIIVVSKEADRIKAAFPDSSWTREEIGKTLVQLATAEGIALEFDAASSTLGQNTAPHLSRQDEYERSSPIYGQPVDRRADADEQ